MEKFRRIKKIGMGTFGYVDFCYHIPSQKFCSLKCMSKRNLILLEQVEHVQSERRILTSISHPNIVTVYGTFQDEEFLYIMMEFIPGGELFAHLRTNIRFDPNKVRFYACEIFMVLEFLHQQSIIYRDLKLENLLLDIDGHVKFIDFGFAKVVTERTYTMCGTLEYLAPEIIRGEGTTFASDWWAFGVLIYELLVGHSPFANLPEEQCYVAICQGVQSYPDEIDEITADLLDGLFELDPYRRLGGGNDGSNDIKRHPYFEGIDWELMRLHAYQPLAIPMVTSPFDTSNYPEYPRPEYEPMTPEMHSIRFDNF